jgi:CDP-diacylglycerol--glycerol-3-phosphate 3-phosphatidyltransferase
MPQKTYPHDRVLAATLLKLVPKETAPNQITVARIFMTPMALWLLYEGRYDLGVPFFLVTALTDMLDGSLARVRDQVTDWGKTWDPIADKLLIGSVAVLLLTRHFPLELTIVILAFEAAFLAGGWYRRTQGVIVSANWWGKFKMLSQVAGVTLFLVALMTGAPAFATASYAAFGVAIAFATVSLFRQGV